MARKQEAAPTLGWWGERWLDYMTMELHVGPSSDGQLNSALRAATQMAIARGRVQATVAVGQYGATARAVLKVKPLTAVGWRRVLDAIAAVPDTAHRLLSGNPGPDLEAAFAGVEQELFPQYHGAGQPVRCTCGERWDCRHVNALVVHGAAFFDTNPLLWLEVLGQGRAAIFAGLRARLADSGRAVPTGTEIALTDEGTRADAPLSAAQFWQTETDPDSITVRPGSAAMPDALLRLLGPIPVPAASGWVELWDDEGLNRHSLDEVLRRYVTHIGEGASALARGDRTPIYAPQPGMGKAIAPGVRLAPEVEEAVRQAGAVLSLEQLRTLSPTAAALPEGLYRASITDMVADLPPDLVVLGHSYVAPRAMVLQGAAFSHVITFDEWRQGGLSEDADWARALAVAGHRPPYTVWIGEAQHPTATLGGALAPQVGDEVRLTVRDPDQPVLAARLVRRIHRSHAGHNRSSQQAARVLLGHLSEPGRNALFSEGSALGVLLGSGRYQGNDGLDPVWLLPLWLQELSHLGPGREITTAYAAWQPTFGRPAYGYWSERKALLPFQAELMRRGAKRDRVEMATACVTWWCRNYRGVQDDADQPVPLGALLNFLWIVAPLEVSKYRIAPERVPECLAIWFTVLSEGGAELARAYADHIAACELIEPFMDRLQTKPRRPGGEEQTAWMIEGYRWIGPDRFFAAAEPDWWR